jgi:gluconolactonase
MTGRLMAAVAGVCFILLPAPPAWAQRKRPLRQFELRAESPKFWELIDRDAAIEKFAGDFGFTEGPVWDERGFLYVSDELQNKIFRVFPGGRKEEVLSIGDPDGSTFDRNHRLVSTADLLRAVIAVDSDGNYRVLADNYNGQKLNSPNDVTLGPDGAIYFTDPTLDLPKGEKQETPFQGVYRLGADGSLRLLIKDLDQPNGLAFSPDGRRLYVADTKRREIYVYEVAANGEVGEGRLFGKEEGTGGAPDGMRVDMRGNLFVTGPQGIWVWDPEGHHLGTIVVPENAANMAWGDQDYQTLYITAATSVYRIRTKTRGFVPGAGK